MINKTSPLIVQSIAIPINEIDRLKENLKRVKLIINFSQI